MVQTRRVVCDAVPIEEDGYDAWLRYRPLQSKRRRHAYRDHCRTVVIRQDESDSPVLAAAVAELERGLNGLLGEPPARVERPDGPGTIRLSVVATHPRDAATADAWQPVRDQFSIRSKMVRGHTCIDIDGQSDRAVLYGVFHFLRRLQTHQSLHRLDICETPAMALRLVNQWDNISGTIERGYGGPSIFNWRQLPRLDARYTDYARLLASVGLNGCAVNNVNTWGGWSGEQQGWRLLTTSYIQKLAALASVFRCYGIRLFVSISYAAPMLIGKCQTADPLNHDVQAWWRAKARELYRAIPDFGGFLVKVDAEGVTGPHAYDRDHAIGANMLAEALAPYGGLVLWRGFVYHAGTVDRKRARFVHDPKARDRAVQAYENFKPLDGRFAGNVAIQVKNGPIDFQVREPVSPLIGGLTKTNVVMELQITQEYTGQAMHVCFLVPQWKDILDFDTHARGRGSTVQQILRGAVFPTHIGGIAGVLNWGADPNWAGYHLSQANAYGFGRLAWNPDLSARQIAREWVQMTFGHEAQVVRTLVRMLLASWSIYEQYNAPLGAGFMCDDWYHNAPKPWRHQPCHGATRDGVGSDRTQASGSGFTQQYYPPVARRYESHRRCPDALLLFFHHVPYTHLLRSGKSVIQHIYDTHYEGVERTMALRQDWQALEGRIDPRRYREVLERLTFQVKDARRWRNVINRYFCRLSGIADAHHRFKGK